MDGHYNLNRTGGLVLITVNLILGILNYMRDSNNLPKAISHKKLSSLLINAHKDRFSSIGEDDLIEMEQQEFTELLENWEENTKNIKNKVSSKNKNLLENKSSNALMALGAMEVHLNMALQALKVFINDKKE